MDFKIEKGVPMSKTASRGKYPFDQMEVGDSFLITENYDRESVNRIASAARGYGTRQSPVRKFTVRKTKEGGLRVWRTE